jgi:hypothetical protein
LTLDKALGKAVAAQKWLGDIRAMEGQMGGGHALACRVGLAAD